MKYHTLYIYTALLSVLSSGGLIANAYGQAVPPAWASDPEATYQIYLFDSNDETPEPDAQSLNNPFGTPTAQVNWPLPFASGWQDPVNPNNFAGITPADGAWEIGPDGDISATIPFSSITLLPGESFTVEFQVSTVGLVGGFGSLAGLEIDGFVPSNFTSNDVHVEDDPFPTPDAWYRRTFTGSVENVTDNSLTFRLTTPNNSMSYWIDNFEIYTRYTVVPVPEPTSLLLVAGGLSVILLRRRQS